MSLQNLTNGNPINDTVNNFANSSNLLGALPGSFDKRDGNAGWGSKVKQIISMVNGVSDLLGGRPPELVIGDVPADNWATRNSKYMPSAVKGLIRAVENTLDLNQQTGVIIDGFDSITADITIDLPKNPMMYRSNYITDQRVRTPNTLKMVVYVNNYLSDDIIGTVTNILSGNDPTGLLGEGLNMLTNNGNTRAQNALYKMRYLQENGIPFTVYTPHGIFENMLIKTIGLRTEATSMDTLVCDITFNELLMYVPNNSTAKPPTRTNIVPTSSMFDFSSKLV